MIILGIETSCDETSAALLEVNRGKFELLSHVVSSSVKQQSKYGGIVPEIAARKQIEYMIPVLNETFKQGISNSKFLISSQIPKPRPKKRPKLPVTSYQLLVDCVAVTIGPGLATSLQVGIDTAKALAYSWQKPLIPTNHLEGHLLSPLLAEKEILNSKSETRNKSKIQNSKFQVQFPAIGLIVSGGHTELILVNNHLNYKLLGRTRDDAAGEAFDKVAKLLGLGYPGGPAISKLASQGNPKTYDFPRGMINSGDFDFSFSGLKTSVLYSVKKQPKMRSKKQLPHVTASFEQAVVDVLVAKSMKALKQYKAKTLLVGGGVVANPTLRDRLVESCKLLDVSCLLSPLAYTGDNAAMIALAGYFRYKTKQYVKPGPQSKGWSKITTQPNLKLI